MAQYDGSVLINTKINVKNAEIQLSSLENRMSKTADKISDLRGKMEALGETKIPTPEYASLEKELSMSEKKLEQFYGKIRKLEKSGGITPQSDIKETRQQISDMEKELFRLVNVRDHLSAKDPGLGLAKKGVEDYEKKLDALKKKLEEQIATNKKVTNSSSYKNAVTQIGIYEQKIDELRNNLDKLEQSGKAFTLGSDSEKYADYARQLEYAQNDLSVMVEKHELLNQKIESSKAKYVSLGNSIKSGVKGLISLFEKLGNVVSKGVKGSFEILGNIAKGAFSRIIKSTNSANKSFGLSFKNILKYGFGIRSLYALFNKLRSAIKEGYQNLYNDNERFKNSVDSLKASATTLKNSLAAAFRPLVDIAIPYIQKVMDYMSGLLDSVGQFLAAITGQKMYTKAIKQTTAALKEEKKAAEGYLSPLDEINKYQTNKDSGADAGTGGTMFQELPISDKFKDLAQWFKDMWAAADFTELGTLIGEKLKNALDNIPWNQIKEVARKIGSSIATFINGFVEVKDLGYSIGRTLAEAVNTGFEFLNEFVHKLHWDSIGHFIADSLNGIFQNIDWPLIYDTFVTGFKGMAQSINQFIADFHWDNISDAVSNLVNIIAEMIYTFFTKTDFSELGKKLGEQLKKSIEKIDWQDVGRAIGAIIQSAIDFVKNLVGEIDFKDVADSITNALKGMFSEMNMDDVATVLLGLFVSSLVMQSSKLKFIVVAAALLMAFADSFKEVDWTGIGESIANAINNFFEKFDGAKLAKGATAFLSGLLDTIIATVATIDWEAIWRDIIDFLTNIDYLELIQKLAVAAYYLINGLVDGLIQTIKETDWGAIWGRILQAFKDFFGIHSPSTVMEEQGTFIMQGLLNGISSLVDSVKEIWNDIKENISGIMDDVKSNISSKLDNIKSSWSSAWEGMKSTVGSIIESVKSIISSAFDWISDKVNDIADKISSIGKKSSIIGGAGSRFLSSSFSSNKYLRSAPSPAFASLAEVPIPKLATGAVIPANKEFLAVLGDQKHGTNIEAPLETLRQANEELLLKVLSKLGISGELGGGGTYKFVAQIDGRTLFEETINRAKFQQMSTGQNPFVL